MDNITYMALYRKARRGEEAILEGNIEVATKALQDIGDVLLTDMVNKGIYPEEEG